MPPANGLVQNEEMNRRLLLSGLSGLAIVLAGCSTPPATKSSTVAKKEQAPPEPLTGRAAFYKMFPSARSWAADAIPLRLISIAVGGIKPSGGKAGAWQAIFVSPGTSRSRVYSYSVVEAEGNLHQGVFAESPETYSGPTGEATPFPVSAIKYDSDQAYEEAVKHVAAYVAKHPDKPVNCVLELSNRFPDAAWQLSWGGSSTASPTTVFTDASTGKFLRKSQ